MDNAEIQGGRRGLKRFGSVTPPSGAWLVGKNL
jgi:hypothetical protein